MASSMATILLLIAGFAAADDPPPADNPPVDQTELSAPVKGIEALFSVGPMASAEPVNGTVPDQSSWTVICDSEQVPYNCSNILDGDNSTYWESSSGWPQTMTVDMKSVRTVSGISMLPQNSTDGNIAVHEVYVSIDGEDWGDAQAFGTWWGDATQKTSVFEPVQAQYVRLVSYSAALGEPHLQMAEFQVFTINDYVPPPLDPTQGRWGPTIDFPIVPAGGWVDPTSGRVITYSSYGHDRFDQRQGLPPDILGRTLTSTWDPATNEVTQRIVNETGHDMFCPGMALDFNGRMIITGGRSNLRTSIYDQSSDSWVRMANMRDPRGYQSSVTVADGRVFTIGGSWDAVDKSCQAKDGEIYNPDFNTWRPMPQCPVKPMWTAETTPFNTCPTFRRDNHGWLFPWKRYTVFQAGPSIAMNWYSMSGNGGIFAAGNRSDDLDAMCGAAVMYDAPAGKILTAGGSRLYILAKSRPSTYLMTLGNPNATVKATRGPDMNYARMYHNAMILPNGDTMVVGGRTLGGLFVDGPKAVLRPEIYSPTRNQWTLMANHSIPRTYHSIGLLLPDATVFSAGGGLCGACDFNHFDGQIYTPPYLLTSTGDLATRPVIVNVESSEVEPGSYLTFTTDSPVKTASLIRYGSATHGINTDQRRIPLTLTPLLPSTVDYSALLPSEAGVIIAGYWMLFVMDDAGVPSVAATIKIIPN